METVIIELLKVNTDDFLLLMLCMSSLQELTPDAAGARFFRCRFCVLYHVTRHLYRNFAGYYDLMRYTFNVNV